MKIVIKHRHTGVVLFEHEATDEQQSSGIAMRVALEAACRAGANLSDAYLNGANLYGAYLSGANLSGANLNGANLSGANLSDAYLSGANLNGANLSDAYLNGANLSDAYLNGANLYGAYLSGANLSDAYLSGANLNGANLSGAYLSGGKKLVGDRPTLIIGPIGSRSDYLQAYVTDSGVMVRAGCFFGSRDEFAARVRGVHGDSVHGREYAAALVLIDAHAELWTPAVEPAKEAA